MEIGQSKHPLYKLNKQLKVLPEPGGALDCVAPAFY